MRQLLIRLAPPKLPRAVRSFLILAMGSTSILLLSAQNKSNIRMMAKIDGGSRFANISSFTVAPASISFTTSNPDAGQVSISGSTIISHASSGGDSNKALTINIKANTANFTNCATVPVSAIQVASCSAVVTSSGSGTCLAAPFSLTTGDQALVTGKQPAGSGTSTTTITFTVAESWRYIGAISPLCTLSLTYTIILQ